MAIAFGSVWRSLRARWRWLRGYCPLCNRKLRPTFAYYMAAYPDCSVCKAESTTDLTIWQKYAAVCRIRTPVAAGASG